MIVALTIAVVLAFLATAAAGLCYGLWRGERGRRVAAENLKVFGAPERLPALTSDRDAASPEQRAMEAGRLVSEQTIQRGAEDIVREYKARGMDVTIEEARRQAEMMLQVGEFMPDTPPIDLPVPL